MLCVEGCLSTEQNSNLLVSAHCSSEVGASVVAFGANPTGRPARELSGACCMRVAQDVIMSHMQDLRERRLEAGPALLGIALLLGFLMRLALIVGADFPLKDGGLFVSMARDIRQAGFGLPELSTFNTGEVPFAYPPLGIYILALIPGDPVTTERWLPLIWSMAAIPGAFLLARELVDERLAGLASLLFALMPVTWAIEGGGVTRGLALALLLWSIWAVAQLLRNPTLGRAVLGGLLTGAAALSHPAVGPAWLGSVALLLFWRPSRRGFLFVGGASMLALTFVAPWLGMIIARYGLGAIITAGQAHHLSETLARLVATGPSWIGTLDLIFPLALLGICVQVAGRRWFLTCWLALLVLVPGGEGRYAAITWAILAAVGADTVMTALSERSARQLASAVAVTVLFLGAGISGYQRFGAIPTAVRDAMREAGAATPAGTRFAVYIDDQSLEQPILDWFPTLSGRVSVGTFMGLEWTSSQRWDATVALNGEIQQGTLPSTADAVFRVEDGAATWRLLPFSR